MKKNKNKKKTKKLTNGELGAIVNSSVIFNWNFHTLLFEYLRSTQTLKVSKPNRGIETANG